VNVAKHLVAVALVSTCLGSGLARAQSAVPENQVLAQSLFDDAVALMRDGRYVEACPKFAESHRLDPAGGTVINLAYCLEKQKKLASAYAAYSDAVSFAIRDGRKEREATARERVQAIAHLLSRIAVRVEGPSQLEGLEVFLDGTALRPAAWGGSPVDPGPHRVRATAPGHREWVETLTVDAEGQTREVVVPVLPLLPPEPSVAPPPVAPPVHVPVDERPASGWRRPAAIVSFGVGGAALGAGLVTGALAISRHNASNRDCPSGRCTQGAVDAETAANTFAWIANVSFAAAVVGGGLGAYFLLTGKSDKTHVTFDASPQGGSVLVRHAF
jgi:hypothetical protein